MMNSKENTKQLSLSIGTESQYSATSPEPQMGGGFLSGLFGGSDESSATQLALDAFVAKNGNAGLFILDNMLSKKQPINFSQTTNNGLNILHMLTIYSSINPEAKRILMNVLKNTNAKEYINAQDSRGNTISHFAVKSGQDDLVQMFISLGANLSVQNNDGYKISIENVPVRKEPIVSTNNNADVFVKMSENNCGANGNKVDISDRIAQLVKLHRGQTDSDGTIGFMRSDAPPNLNIAAQMFERSEPSKMFGGSESSEIDSVDVLNMIMNDFKLFCSFKRDKYKFNWDRI